VQKRGVGLLGSKGSRLLCLKASGLRPQVFFSFAFFFSSFHFTFIPFFVLAMLSVHHQYKAGRIDPLSDST